MQRAEDARPVDATGAIDPTVVLPGQFLSRGVPRGPDDLFQQLNIHRRRLASALGQGRHGARLSAPNDPAQQGPGIQIEAGRDGRV